ncbi:MAG TPA: hypothetical protein VKV32_17830 [Stellaceae bacterium]|nr:hypothetical protein [Stellaceae bacterium]
MSWYRAYFLNDHRRIVDVEEFRSFSDAQALKEASALLEKRGNFPAFELWQGARPISLYPQNRSVAA